MALRAYRNTDTAVRILALQILGAVAVLTDPRYAAEEFLSRSEVSIPVCAILDGDSLQILSLSESENQQPDAREPSFVIFTTREVFPTTPSSPPMARLSTAGWDTAKALSSRKLQSI